MLRVVLRVCDLLFVVTHIVLMRMECVPAFRALFSFSFVRHVLYIHTFGLPASSRVCVLFASSRFAYARVACVLVACKDPAPPPAPPQSVYALHRGVCIIRYTCAVLLYAIYMARVL